MTADEKAQNLAAKEKIFRDAVRWLFEAERFMNSYSSDTWREDGLSQIADVSHRAHLDAIRGVITAHKELMKAKQ